LIIFLISGAKKPSNKRECFIFFFYPCFDAIMLWNLINEQKFTYDFICREQNMNKKFERALLIFKLLLLSQLRRATTRKATNGVVKINTFSFLKYWNWNFSLPACIKPTFFMFIITTYFFMITITSPNRLCYQISQYFVTYILWGCQFTLYILVKKRLTPIHILRSIFSWNNRKCLRQFRNLTT
jgi:hypothetical protein